MFKPKAAVVGFIVAAGALLTAAPAVAAPAAAPVPAPVASNSDCIAYAQKNLAGQNWACFAGNLSNYGSSTTGPPKSTKKFTRPARTGLATT